MALPAASVPELRTNRLLLRGWHDADLAPFAELGADRAGMEHFPALLSAEDSDAFVGRVMEGVLYRLRRVDWEAELGSKA